MAKIALFCESYHETTRDLARALHSLRHEVTVVTSRHVDHSEQLPFPVLTFFKKWSALEALRFIPRFISNAPDVWHFCFPEPRRYPPRSGHLILAGLAKGLPHRIAIASFFSVLPKLSIPLRGLTPLCDVLTFGAREDLMNAKRSGLASDSTLLEVFPPLPRTHILNHEILSDDFLSFINNLKPYLFVWREDVSAAVHSAASRAGLKLLVKGPRNLHKAQLNTWFLPEGASQNQIRYAAHNSKGILCQDSDLELSELHRLQNLSQTGRVPLFISGRQAEALPGLCLPRRTGWVLDSTEDFRRILSSTEFSAFRFQAGPETTFSIQDSAINDLNRLMMKALAKA